MTYRLLVVDDEDTTRRSLADILQLEGYQVDTAEGGRAAIQMIAQQAYDLILLDLKMPDVDGLDVLRYVTGKNQSIGTTKQGTPLTPACAPAVILLTAHGSLESAIEALRLEAQDYLLKPASPEQITLSVAQGLRMRGERTQKNIPAVSKYHLPGNIIVDLTRREIHYQPGQLDQKAQVFKMTLTEGKLMGVFLANPGRVFSHRELVLLVQGYETKEWEAPEILRPLVSRLRRKIRSLPGSSGWITSVRGTGYVFEIEGTPIQGRH